MSDSLPKKKKNKNSGDSCWQQVQCVHLSVTVVVLQIKAEPSGWYSRPVILSTLWLPVSDRIQLQLLHTSSKEGA